LHFAIGIRSIFPGTFGWLSPEGSTIHKVFPSAGFTALPQPTVCIRALLFSAKVVRNATILVASLEVTCPALGQRAAVLLLVEAS
jgi:hypothetical protein